MIALDTNVIVRFLVRDDETQAEAERRAARRHQPPHRLGIAYFREER